MKQIINSHKLQELIEKRQSFLIDAEKYALEIEFLSDEIDRLIDQCKDNSATTETTYIIASETL